MMLQLQNVQASTFGTTQVQNFFKSDDENIRPNLVSSKLADLICTVESTGSLKLVRTSQK